MYVKKKIKSGNKSKNDEIINMLLQAASAINVSARGFLSWWFMHI